jgi:pimeloyl-ACP methyl ester carboxylesterase
MPYPLVELGGTGPVLHLALANGFPPETYLPVVEPLARRYRVVCLPPRALWKDAGPPPADPGSWDMLAEDLLEGMRRHGLDRVIGVGHSFGAVTTLLAAVREPTRFRALCFLDPTILPPAVIEDLRRQRERGEMSYRPLVQGALKRRSAFATEAEAFGYWRAKPLFDDWTDDAVSRYTTSMLRPAGDGGGFTLAWSAAWEAWYYLSFYAESWTALDMLDPAIPLLVVRGERSDVYVAEAEALLRVKRPGAVCRVIPGHGHLFPQAVPGETAREIQAWLDELPGRHGVTV